MLRRPLGLALSSLGSSSSSCSSLCYTPYRGASTKKPLEEGASFFSLQQQIADYCRLDLPDKATAALRRLKKEGGACNTASYNQLIEVFASRRRADRAQSFFDELRREPTESPDVNSYNGLIRAYGASKEIKKAHLVFSQMGAAGLAPTIDTFNALLSGFVTLGDVEGGRALFQRIQNESRPNLQTMKSLLRLFATDLSEARSCFESIPSFGLQADEECHILWMQILGAEGLYGEARLVFEILEQNSQDSPSAEAFTALIGAALNGEDADTAFSLYEQMRKNERQPSTQTFDLMIHFCGETNRMHEASHLIAEMESLGVTPSLRVDRVKQNLGRMLIL